MNSHLFCILFLLSKAKTLRTPNSGREGDACDRNDNNWYSVSGSKIHFIYCHPKHGIYVRDHCSTTNGNQKKFDPDLQQCVIIRNGTTVTHPVLCKRSHDCPNDKWFCSAKDGLCHCKRNFVQIGGDCWRMIKINEGECIYDQQCIAVWPTARCLNGQCKCPSPLVDVATSTGYICTLPGKCPLGEDYSILPGSWGCHRKGECGIHGSLNHLYDCILTSPAVSYCCPNRANICMQPAMPGNGSSSSLRYHYDSNVDYCVSFVYRGGSLVNANVFHSKAGCNIYCRTGCPRGIPEKTKIGDSKLCENNFGCGMNYSCFKRDTGDTGICCPKAEWICSAVGGKENVVTQFTTEEYDTGFVHPETVFTFYPLIRYYFSQQENRCKPFYYKGMGGNFNHFLSLSQCQSFCKEIPICTDNAQCPGESKCRLGVCSAQNALFSITEPNDISLQTIELAAALKSGVPEDVEINTTVMPTTSATIDYTFDDFKYPLLPAYNFTDLLLHSASRMTKSTAPISNKSYGFLFSCPGNRSPQLDSLGNRIFCDYESIDLDPKFSSCNFQGAYNCAFHTLSSQRGICCSSLNIDQYRCPTGYILLTNEERKAVACSPKKMTPCLAQGSICVFDEFYGSYHCCRKMALHNTFTLEITEPPVATTVSVQKNTLPVNSVSQDHAPEMAMSQENSFGCPPAQTPFEDPIVNGIPDCDPLDNASCPPGFKCYRSAIRHRYQCCGLNSICPQNSAAYVSPLKNMPLGCDLKRGCLPSFFCYRSSRHINDNGVCCSVDPIISLCDHGLALRDDDGRSVKCDNDKKCPLRGYNCLNRFNISICCPTREQVCSQPPNKGTICIDKKKQIRYYFDPYAKKCKEFMFSGCSDNDNNFETMNDCLKFCRHGLYCPIGFPLTNEDGNLANCSEKNQNCLAGYECMRNGVTNYCCPKLEVVCSLPKSEGNVCSPYRESSAKMLMWHFSTTDHKCQQFNYHGCYGNINRFSSKQHCLNTCFSELCPVGNPYMVNYSLVQCSKKLDCPTGYLCIPSKFGRGTINICCSRPETLCTNTVDENEKDCGISLYRYRYVASQDRCVSVLQSACSPNANSFDNSLDCKRLCVKSYAVCPSSERFDLSKHTHKALTCSPLFEICPSGYYCSSFSSFSFRICCPNPKCPSERNPMAHSNGTLVKCNVEESDPIYQCPSNYKCQLLQDGQYRCCPRATIQDACPSSSRPYVQMQKNSPTLCTEQEPRCPEGYTCYENKKYSESFCCSENGTPFEPLNLSEILNGNLILNYKQLCMDGTEPVADLLGVRICQTNHSCPRNYHCQYNRYFDRNQCCRNGFFDGQQANSVCPSGMIMYPHPRTGFPIICRSNVYGFCPRQSSCEYSTFYWQFICCTKTIEYDDSDNVTTISVSAIRLGETPCFNDKQCKKDSVCRGSVCQCPETMKIFENECVYSCPSDYEEQATHCVRRQ